MWCVGILPTSEKHLQYRIISLRCAVFNVLLILLELLIITVWTFFSYSWIWWKSFTFVVTFAGFLGCRKTFSAKCLCGGGVGGCSFPKWTGISYLSSKSNSSCRRGVHIWPFWRMLHSFLCKPQLTETTNKKHFAISEWYNLGISDINYYLPPILHVSVKDSSLGLSRCQVGGTM